MVPEERATKYLLSETLTTAYHIKLLPEGCIALSSRTHFELTASGVVTLRSFLQAVRIAPMVRHTYTDAECILEYDPGTNDVQILHRVSDTALLLPHFALWKLW